MTKIEWTDATWNPVTGCTKVSQGCKNCYAERLAPKVFAGQTVEFDTTPPKHPEMKASGFRPRVFTDVMTHAERLDAPLHWKKPRRIFVNSMSDLFHEDVPDEFIDRVFAMMALSPQHTFQILTKRPSRLLQYMTDDGGFGRWGFIDGWARRFYEGEHNKPFPAGKILIGPLPHVWLGVSVEDQATADERIPLLLQTPAAVRFLSCEPLLGPIDCRPAWNRGLPWLRRDGISWVIAGGESGPKARPSHPDWFRSLRDQCAAAGVQFFFKQHGEWAPLTGMLSEAPKYRRIHIWEHDFHGGVISILVGKKAAGRLLDGREHSEYPA